MFIRRFCAQGKQLGMLATISTGSKAIDALLGGGVHAAMVTDVYGESGSGKSQLCFTLCANCVKDGSRVVFVDTAGTFRPERIVEIAGYPSALEKITFVRALSTLDQANTFKKILNVEPGLVVIDTLTSLFSAEYAGPARHLALMKHLHELALVAINAGCAVVVTNMIRNAPLPVMDQTDYNMSQSMTSSQQREYLGSSVSIYSHMKLKLGIIDAAKSLFQARLMFPEKKEPVIYAVTTRGVSDAD